MTVRANTLFMYDARGRMVCTNELDKLSPPYLFLGHTSGGCVVRFAEFVPDAVARDLTELIDSEGAGSALRISPSVLTTVRMALEEHISLAGEGGGPAYRLPESLRGESEAVQVTDANLDVVRDTYPWLLTELADWWPCFAVVRDGAAVSVCFSSRVGTEAAEAGVNTLPDFRGRGYAAAVTAAWGASIRASGHIPLYSTDWDNRASQSVARRLGLIMFGTDATWTERVESSS